MLNWRLLVDGAFSGATNMAVDHAIMAAVGNGLAPPTLRLYAWEPPCLSLGYNQPMHDVDTKRLTAYGWHLVRRPTGGKAILHTDELTYSVALPKDDPLVAGGIVQSYRRLSRALLAALELTDAHLSQQLAATPTEQRSSITGPVCFEMPSDYEITAQGKKLIGSAQVRRGDAVLQHGTLPLYGDIARIIEVLAFEDEMARRAARQRVQKRATTFEAVLGKCLHWDAIAPLVVQGFQQTFNIQFTADELSAEEQQHADELVNTVYCDDAWTHRR